MTRRIVSSATAFAALFVASILLALATVLPAFAADSATLVAAQGDSSGIALQAAAKKTVEADYYVSSYYSDDVYYQGKGATLVYDINDLKTNYYYGDNNKIKIVSIKGKGDATFERVKGQPGFYYIKATKSGQVTVTCKETWTEEEFDDDAWEYVEKKHSAKHTFTIKIISLKNNSGTLDKCTTVDSSSYYYTPTPYAYFTFKISGLPKNGSVEFVKDSNKKGDSYVSNVTKGKVKLYVSGAGTHIIKLKAYGKTFKCKAVLRVLSMKKTENIKYTGGMVAYPGSKSRLTPQVTGIKSPKAKWSSTDTSVATVSKGGLVKAHKKGRAYIKAKYKGATVKVLVEVTSYGAYQAVKNAFYDSRQPIVYSQANRMSAGYRDCSSFVWRCYWDNTQGRHIIDIGGYGWAPTAAGEALWLHNQDKIVAWDACSVKKLRPGDCVFMKTGYAGANTEWLGIDHAAIYVGNGCLAQTHSGNGKGDVGISHSYYAGSAKSTGIWFIGRPCP